MKSSFTSLYWWQAPGKHDRCIKLARIFTLFLTLFTIVSSTSMAQTVVEKYGRLQKFGSHICAEDGEQISLAGNSFFWSNWAPMYYNANTVDFLVDEMQTSIVRAAMAIGTHGSSVPGSYLEDPAGQKALVESIVDRAIERGVYVIIDWHVEGDTRSWKSQAQQFFSEMAQKYGHHPNVIYEIWNEPTHNNWHSDIRPYAVDVINSIRQHDPDNLIIVGTETWSQRPDDAATNQIPDPNIAYTIHFYPDDPGNGQFHRHQLRANVTAAMNQGAAVFATEWGPSDAAPNPESDIWMQFLIDNKISHCMWSVNDKIADGDWQWSIFAPGTPGTGPYTLRGPGFYLQDLMHNWPWKAGGGTQCTAVNIPGRVEAEIWCNQSGVQTEPTTDAGGGENVGWIDTGDWIEYLVNAPGAGSYQLDFRLAADGSASKSFNILADGVQVGAVNFTATGGWQTWTTVNTSVNLNAGEQTIRLEATSDGFNINYIDFSSECSNPDLATLEITPNNPTIAVGETIDLDVIGRNGCGEVIGTNPTWTGADQNGVFTGTTEGVFQVTASENGISAQVDVTVTNSSSNNMLTNGNFSNGSTGWESYVNGAASASLGVSGGEFHGNISNGGSAGWHVQWYQGGLTIANGNSYTLSFDARAANNRTISANVEMNGDPWTAHNSETVNLTTQMQSFSYTFTMNNPTDNNARVLFNLGTSSADVYIDNVVLIDNGNSNPGWSLKIEAEDYSVMSGIQTENTSDTGGGLNVGWIDAGDWLSFHDIDIPANGSYTISYRVASQNGGGQLQFEQAGGSPVYGTLNINATGGWQTWTTISHTVNLNAGVQDFGISAPAGGWNLNWFEIASNSGARVENETYEFVQETPEIAVYPVPAGNTLYVNGLNKSYNMLNIYGLDGRKFMSQSVAGESYLQLDISTLESGVYLLQFAGLQNKTIRLVKN